MTTEFSKEWQLECLNIEASQILTKQMCAIAAVVNCETVLQHYQFPFLV